MSECLKTLSEAVRAPLEKLFLILGVVLVLLSFSHISRKDKWDFELIQSPNPWLLCIGIGLIAICIYCTLRTKIPRLSSVKGIPNGHRLKLSPSLTIDIVMGNIENIESIGPHGAFVLPSNTTLDDECINDTRSALGAFFQKHFPTGIEKIQQMITNEADNIMEQSKEAASEYVPGTTIFLDRPLGTQHKILVTAVTRFSHEEGFKADTLSIIASMKGVFRASAGHRISELCLPVIGTGHGGLDFSAALSLMLVHSVNCVMHEGANHIKHIIIVVYDPDNSRQSKVQKVIQAIGGIFGG